MFRLKPTTLLLCLLGPAFGRSMVQAPQPEVDVCMRLAASVPFGLLAQSETTVTQLFQDIDVKIPWTSQSPKTNVAVRVSDQTPVDFHKGALAYALPYARRGDRVFVFYDRFAPLTISAPIAAAAVFGHILAHEIGHVLVGVASHEDSGLMGPKLTAEELLQMRLHRLRFTPQQGMFVYRNLTQHRIE